MEKIASFDIEIAKDVPGDFDNWKEYVPLGITCAAVALSDSDDVKFWQGKPQLTKDQCVELVHELQALVEQGYKLLTWNGASFDFQVLAQETGLYDACGNLTMNHIDLMLHVTFTKGWFLGLQKALVGAGLEGKLKSVTLSNGAVIDDMSGAKAPRLWLDGEYDAVLDYLREDVVQPLRLARDIELTRSIRWMSNAGRPQSVTVNKLLTVAECFAIPEPDTSWMTDPPGRDSFVDWIPGYEGMI